MVFVSLCSNTMITDHIIPDEKAASVFIGLPNSSKPALISNALSMHATEIQICASAMYLSNLQTTV